MSTNNPSCSTILSSPAVGRERRDMREYLQRMERLFEDVQAQKEQVLARTSLRTPGRFTPVRRATDPGSPTVLRIRILPPASPSVLRQPPRDSSNAHRGSVDASSTGRTARLGASPTKLVGRRRTCSSLTSFHEVDAPKIQPIRPSPSSGQELPAAPGQELIRAVYQDSVTRPSVNMLQAQRSCLTVGTAVKCSQPITMEGQLTTSPLPDGADGEAANSYYSFAQGLLDRQYNPLREGMQQLSHRKSSKAEQVPQTAPPTIAAGFQLNRRPSAQCCTPTAPATVASGLSPQNRWLQSGAAWMDQAVQCAGFKSPDVSGRLLFAAGCDAQTPDLVADDDVLMASPTQGATRQSEFGWGDEADAESKDHFAAQAGPAEADLEQRQRHQPPQQQQDACTPQRAVQPMPGSFTTPPLSVASTTLTTPDKDQHYWSPSVLRSGARSGRRVEGCPPNSRLKRLVVVNTAFSPATEEGVAADDGKGATCRNSQPSQGLAPTRLAFGGGPPANAGTQRHEQAAEQQETVNAVTAHVQGSCNQEQPPAALGSGSSLAAAGTVGGGIVEAGPPVTPAAAPPEQEVVQVPQVGCSVAAISQVQADSDAGGCVEKQAAAGVLAGSAASAASKLVEGGVVRPAETQRITEAEGCNQQQLPVGPNPVISSASRPGTTPPVGNTRLAALARLKCRSLHRPSNNSVTATTADPPSSVESGASPPATSPTPQDGSLAAPKLRLRSPSRSSITTSPSKAGPDATRLSHVVEVSDGAVGEGTATGARCEDRIPAHRPQNPKWDSAISQYGVPEGDSMGGGVELAGQAGSRRVSCSSADAGGSTRCKGGALDAGTNLGSTAECDVSSAAAVEGGSEAALQPKPFLRRRSQAVVPSKPPDWSQVRPRTQSHLDANLIPAGSRGGTPKAGAGCGIGFGTPRRNGPVAPGTLHPRQPAAAPRRPVTPTVHNGVRSQSGAAPDRPGSANGSRRGAAATPQSGSQPVSTPPTRPPWGSSRPAKPTAVAKPKATPLGADRGQQQPHSARTTPFSPRSNRRQQQQIYEASTLLEGACCSSYGSTPTSPPPWATALPPASFLVDPALLEGAQLVYLPPGTAVGGRVGGVTSKVAARTRSQSTDPEGQRLRGCAARGRASPAGGGRDHGPLDDLLGQVDRLLSQMEKY